MQMQTHWIDWYDIIAKVMRIDACISEVEGVRILKFMENRSRQDGEVWGDEMRRSNSQSLIPLTAD